MEEESIIGTLSAWAKSSTGEFDLLTALTRDDYGTSWIEILDPRLEVHRFLFPEPGGSDVYL